MTVTNAALAGNQGMHSSSRPQFTYRVTFDLATTYPTGGYVDFFAGLQAVLPELVGKTVIDIRQANPCGGYQLWYDRVNDKLLVYQYPTTLGPATEFPAGALAVVGCEMTIEAT